MSMQHLNKIGLALGAGAAAFLLSVQAGVDLSPYADAAVNAGLAFLSGLGIGIAKRMAP